MAEEFEISEDEYKLVASFYKAQKKLATIFEEATKQSYDKDPIEFIIEFSEAVSAELECDEDVRIKLNEHIKSVVSTIIDRALRQPDSKFVNIDATMYQEFLISALPDFLKQVSIRNNYISPQAATLDLSAAPKYQAE